jgi:hypothetical protein
MKQSKRLISLLLSASLAAGMLPAVALADEADETQIISIDEEQIAGDVTAASESQDAIVIDDDAEEDSEAIAVGEESLQSITVNDEKADVTYVTMNVPYTDFYKAYNPTDSAIWQVADGVDAVTTATTSKFLGTTGLAKGTYNNGKYIMGVTIPVAVQTSDLDSIQADANGSYSYTTLENEPSVYSTLTIADGVYSFSKLQDASVTNQYLSVDGLTLTGQYGDYQIDLEGIETAKGIQIGDDEYISDYSIYGALLNTTDGNSYGMTCLENLWFGQRVKYVEIAWSVVGGQGMQRAHGSGGEFYQFDMNGKTLNSVTLITSLGLIEIPCNKQLPEYYTGDLSKLSLGLSNDSDKLSITGIPEELEGVTISVSDLADKAAVVNNEVQLSGTPVDGTSYTVTISSTNYPDISRTVSTIISEEQKTELKTWIEKAKAVLKQGSDAVANYNDLSEHTTEAEEMVANGTASSAEAAELIDELTSKVKVNYPKATATAELAGTALTIDSSVELSKLENPTYTLTYRAGRNMDTLTSGSLDALSVNLNKTPTVGTEYTLTIVSGNYQDITTTVTAAEAKTEQSITVSKDSYSVSYGAAAFSLGAKTSGDGALTYSSNKTSVADVDSTGKVTIKGVGTATITIKAAETSKYTEASKSVTVTVAAASQTITTGSTSYSKTYGDTAFSLGAKTNGNGALTYSSDKTSVAEVDSTGKVTIKGVGKATITVKAAATNQYKAASKTVTVTVAQAAQTISAQSYTKAYGDKAFNLGAAAKGTLSYKSSNTKVATISSTGKVTIKGVGKTTITINAAATTNYKKAEAKKVTITVNPAATSISSVKNGSSKKMTVKWAKKSSASGYEISYSTSSTFKNAKKATSTSASKTVSGLTKGKTYYVRVRGYKKVSGTTYYSSWSAVKKVKITK